MKKKVSRPGNQGRGEASGIHVCPTSGCPLWGGSRSDGLAPLPHAGTEVPAAPPEVGKTLRIWSRTVLCPVLSRVWLFSIPQTVARQTPLSMGILPARILEWVAVPFSRGSSQPRDWTQVSCIAGGFFTDWATREAPKYLGWVAYPFSRGSSWPRNQTRVSCIAGIFITSWAIGKAQDRPSVNSAWRAGRKGRKETKVGLLRNTAHQQPCQHPLFLAAALSFPRGLVEATVKTESRGGKNTHLSQDKWTFITWTLFIRNVHAREEETEKTKMPSKPSVDCWNHLSLITIERIYFQKNSILKTYSWV